MTSIGVNAKMSKDMIDKRFEQKFIIRFAGIILAGLGIIFLILFLAIPRPDIKDYTRISQAFIEADDTLSSIIGIAVAIDAIVISAIVVLTAVLASHKIAGPLYRFQKVLHEVMAERKAKHIQLRKGDQAVDTARSLNFMLKGLKGNFDAIKCAYEEFEEAKKGFDNTPESLKNLKEKVETLGKAIEKFSL